MKTYEAQKERTTTIESWRYLMSVMKIAKRNRQMATYQKYLDDFIGLCSSNYPTSTELYEQTRKISDFLKKERGINQIEEILKALDYLGVKDLGIDLIREEKRYTPFKREDEQIHKIYTDGAFQQISYQLGSEEKYQMIVRRDSNWELVTTNRIEDGSVIEERTIFLHHLKINPILLPSRQELDSMNFPMKRNVTVGSLGIVPNEFEPDYKQCYTPVKRKYKK